MLCTLLSPLNLSLRTLTLSLDLDLLGFRLLGFRQTQHKDSVVEGRLRLVCVHGHRQSHLPVKLPCANLAAVEVLAFGLGLFSPLASDSQQVAGYADVDVLRLHPRD